MLNWADLMFVMITLAGALGGLAGAREEKAGAVASVLFSLGGLLVGFGAGAASTKLAYLVLWSKKLTDAVVLVLYSIVPTLFFMAVIVGTACLAAWLARHIL